MFFLHTEPAAKPAPKKRPVIASDSDSSPVKLAAKKAAPKKRAVDSDSDSFVPKKKAAVAASKV